jgi:signal transduction histidine kinase
MIRLWPQSLKGQLLLAIALALLLAQGFSAVLLYRAQSERREAAMVHTAAMRLFTATRNFQGEARPHDADRDGDRDTDRHHRPPPELFGGPRSFRLEHSPTSPLRPGEARMTEVEADLRNILADQDVAVADVVVTRRAVSDDPATLQRLSRRASLLGNSPRAIARHVLVTGVRRANAAEWLVVRVVVPPYERGLLATLIGQTILIYGLLVGAIALAMRRITRPLAALTGRLERFADTRDADGQLEPEGPDDVRRLIVAHNAMEDRIAALLDEKDVMLGAIGHDLKTPLAALRVRIESVEDEAERGKMARTIEDIVRTLDDILSLARVGKSSEPREQSELSALVASVVEEYEDMGDPVTLADSARIVLPLRATLLRRALRNLIGNALRYGKQARVSLAQDKRTAIIRIDDDGPGIPDEEIGRMMEPFKRGDPSRNSGTGGTGLGLTLARAIALQHGGSLALANRRGSDGAVEGLTATLRLPLI